MSAWMNIKFLILFITILRASIVLIIDEFAVITLYFPLLMRCRYKQSLNYFIDIFLF